MLIYLLDTQAIIEFNALLESHNGWSIWSNWHRYTWADIMIIWNESLSLPFRYLQISRLDH